MQKKLTEIRFTSVDTPRPYGRGAFISKKHKKKPIEISFLLRLNNYRTIPYR